MKRKPAVAKSARRTSHLENLVKAGAGEEQDRVVAGRDIDRTLAGTVAHALVENPNLTAFKGFRLIVEIVDVGDDPGSNRVMPLVGVRGKIVAIVVRRNLAINVGHLEPGQIQVRRHAGQFSAKLVAKEVGILVNVVEHFRFSIATPAPAQHRRRSKTRLLGFRERKQLAIFGGREEISDEPPF